MLQMYGIKNCDTVKKARKFLEENNVDYEFHDFKKTAPTKKQIDTWLKHIDWQVLLNMRGMTWRKLDDDTKAAINKTNAIKLMLENASIIKRPILEVGTKLFVGFNPDDYESLI